LFFNQIQRRAAAMHDIEEYRTPVKERLDEGLDLLFGQLRGTMLENFGGLA